MDEVTLFDKISNLLGVHSLTITEICSRLNKTRNEVMVILESNPCSFDFTMNSGAKMWKTFEQ